MKKVYTFILSGAAILAVAACNKEMQVEENPQNNDPVYETLSVKVGAETKVTLETGAAKSAFENGDQIAVYIPAGFQTRNVDAEGKITVDISGGARSNYAVYYNGATSPTFESSTLKLTLPETYNYADVADDKNPVPMVAKNVSGEAGDMTFYAVGTLFRVTVKAIPSDATGLVFQFPGNKVNGTFAVTDPGTTAPKITTGAPASGEDKITVTFPANTATEMTLNIPLPTGAYDDVYITPVGGETKVASARHIKAGGYTAARANGRTLTATLVSFSVGAGKKVVFAPGNLVYDKGNWRFHANQYDKCFTSDGDVSGHYTSSGTFDLFGWGSSGIDLTGTDKTWIYYQPWSQKSDAEYATAGSGTTEDPYVYGNPISPYNTFGYGPAYPNNLGVGDWGYNTISGYASGDWRTPTKEDWDAFFDKLSIYDVTRMDAGTVAGVCGLIILPDDFIDPKTSSARASGAFETPHDNSYTQNIYTAEAWKAMENAGAVFLPCEGYRNGTTIQSSINYGQYWTSTAGDSDNASRLIFRHGRTYNTVSKHRNHGRAVRLVRDL